MKLSINKLYLNLGLVALLACFSGQITVALTPAPDISAQVSSQQPVALSQFGDFMGPLLAPFPQSVKDVFANIQITLPKLGIDDPTFAKAGYANNYSISGTVVFYGLQVNAKYIEAKDAAGVAQKSFLLEIPADWKFSQLFPEISKLDILELPASRFIFSTFEYTDPELKYYVQPGFNFASKIKLTGPLAELNAFISNMTNNPEWSGAISYEPGDIVFGGLFDKNDATKSSFNATLPLRFILDLTKISQQPPKYVTRVETDDLVVKIQPGDLAVKITGGAKMYVTSQVAPLDFKGNVAISKTSGQFSLMMDGLYDPAFGIDWLALGNLGVEIDVNAASLTGTPISGVGLRGDMNIGKDPNKAIIQLAGKVDLAADALGDIAFAGGVSNVNLSAFIAYMGEKIAKKPIDETAIPTIKINTATLNIVPKDTYIATKLYRKGISASAEIQLFDVSGGLDFLMDPAKTIFSGGGHINNVDVKIGDQTAFRLSGPGPDQIVGTPDDGPLFNITINPQDPKQNRLILQGTVEIPFIKFSETTDISMNEYGGQAKVTMSVEELFSAMVDLDLKFQNWPESQVKFDFAAGDSFEKFFRERVPAIMSQIKTEAQNDINNWDTKIQQAQDDFSSDVGAELARVETRIQEIDNRLAQIKVDRVAYENDCYSVNVLARIGRDSCKKVDDYKAEKTRLDLEKAGLAVYRDALLKPGSDVAKASLALTAKIATWDDLKKTAQGVVALSTDIVSAISKGLTVFQIKQAAGSFGLKDIKDLKLPKLDKFVVEISIEKIGTKVITLENLQFDFDKPIDSIKLIIRSIVKSLTDAKVVAE